MWGVVGVATQRLARCTLTYHSPRPALGALLAGGTLHTIPRCELRDERRATSARFTPTDSAEEPQRKVTRREILPDPFASSSEDCRCGAVRRICRSSVGVKAWQTEIPTVSAVRPARCSCCGPASRPAGRNLVIHGDGTRERQMRGPESAEGPPRMMAVRARRYQCQRCGT